MTGTNNIPSINRRHSIAGISSSKCVAKVHEKSHFCFCNCRISTQITARSNTGNSDKVITSKFYDNLLSTRLLSSQETQMAFLHICAIQSKFFSHKQAVKVHKKWHNLLVV